jgi:hypothetical protein
MGHPEFLQQHIFVAFFAGFNGMRRLLPSLCVLANDNLPQKPGDFDLFSDMVLEKNAVGGTHNSGKRVCRSCFNIS